MQHKFSVGQVVALSSMFSRYEPEQKFTIIRHMPECDGQLQYRIKGSDDEKERVAKESELGVPG